MLENGLRGVIAAIPTPVDSQGKPDCDKLAKRAAVQLEHGCDGLNLLGTTGEATSFSLGERLEVMNALAEAGLPLDRFMVGTGAAATRDAETLTRTAADLGFAGALILPPFYYNDVTDEGVIRYFERIAEATQPRPIPLYLYNFPALSGVTYTTDLVSSLLQRFGERIAGLKDSSGELAYAESIARLSPRLRVFPSNEAVLLRARAGDFAGCISATANLNAPLCASAYHQGDAEKLEIATSIRALFAGLPLVPGIKAIMARLTSDQTWANMAPPLAQLTGEQLTILGERFDRIPVHAWDTGMGWATRAPV